MTSTKGGLLGSTGTVSGDMSGVVGVCIGRVGAGLDSLATGWKWNQNICHRGVLFQHALTKGGLLGSTGTAVNAAIREMEEGVVMGREGAGLDSLATG